MASAPSLPLATDTSTDLGNLVAFFHLSLPSTFLVIGEKIKKKAKGGKIGQEKREDRSGRRRRKMKEREGS